MFKFKICSGNLIYLCVQAMADGDSGDAEFAKKYPLCHDIGLTKAVLLSPSSENILPHPHELTNGLVLELAGVKAELDLSWNVAAEWMALIAGECVENVNVRACATKVSRIKESRSKLVKNSDKSGIADLLSKPFTLLFSRYPIPDLKCVDHAQSGGISSVFVSDQVQGLSADVVFAEECLKKETVAHEKTKESLACLKKKVHYVQKKTRRRDEKIKQIESEVKGLASSVGMLEEENQDLSESLAESKRRLSAEHERVYYHKRRSSSSFSSLYDAEESVDSLTKELKHCRDELRDYKAALDNAEAMLHAEQAVVTKVDGVFTDEVRQCCHELLSLDVGILNVRPIISSVLAMVGKKPGNLPSVGLLSQMYVELKQVSSLHIGEELAGQRNTTLHSDGTSKFGRKYGSYQIASTDKTFSLGLVDMQCGTAQHMLDKFKEILTDIESTCQKHGHESAGLKLVTGIKNTMSDRCIVQKKFNNLLEDYRSEVLPKVVSSWSSLSEEERTSMMRLNTFFCGLHYIVGLADQASKTLKEWEEVHFGTEKYGATEVPRVFESKESRVIRLIRTATDAFEKHGNEQAGCVADFHAYLDKCALPMPLVEFRGNRSYVIFLNGAGVYFLHETMLHFLKEVHGESNLLLKAVGADLSVPDLVAGTRALGLLSKLVVMPLWRVLEDSAVTIFDMSAKYTDLHKKFVEWSADPAPLLDGTARPFLSAHVDCSDHVLSRLLEPADSDSVTSELLKVLCSTLGTFTARLLSDHLPGGAFHSPTPSLQSEASSVAKTNAISERDFAQLDRLLREKPNASTLAIEGMVMYSNNKTGEWLQSKTAEERAAILRTARTSASDVRDLYLSRQEEIRRYRVKELEEKEKEIRQKKEKQIKRKEELTNGIAKYGGLWSTSSDMRKHVENLSDTGKRAAFRAQLLFRKFVLLQEAPASCFALSKGGTRLSLQELEQNLCSLFTPTLPCTVEATVPEEPPAKRALES